MQGLDAERRAFARCFGETAGEHIVLVLDALDGNKITPVVDRDGFDVLADFDIQGQGRAAGHAQHESNGATK
jgi:hypothetical protein